MLDIESPCPPPYTLCYDLEWLAVLRSTQHLVRHTPSLWLPPHPSTDSRCVVIIMRGGRGAGSQFNDAIVHVCVSKIILS